MLESNRLADAIEQLVNAVVLEEMRKLKAGLPPTNVVMPGVSNSQGAAMAKMNLRSAIEAVMNRAAVVR